jgi:hypothetical protein
VSKRIDQRNEIFGRHMAAMAAAVTAEAGEPMPAIVCVAQWRTEYSAYIWTDANREGTVRAKMLEGLKNAMIGMLAQAIAHLNGVKPTLDDLVIKH